MKRLLFILATAHIFTTYGMVLPTTESEENAGSNNTKLPSLNENSLYTTINSFWDILDLPEDEQPKAIEFILKNKNRFNDDLVSEILVLKKNNDESYATSSSKRGVSDNMSQPTLTQDILEPSRPNSPALSEENEEIKNILSNSQSKSTKSFSKEGIKDNSNIPNQSVLNSEKENSKKFIGYNVFNAWKALNGSNDQTKNKNTDLLDQDRMTSPRKLEKEENSTTCERSVSNNTSKTLLENSEENPTTQTSIDIDSKKTAHKTGITNTNLSIRDYLKESNSAKKDITLHNNVLRTVTLNLRGLALASIEGLEDFTNLFTKCYYEIIIIDLSNNNIESLHPKTIEFLKKSDGDFKLILSGNNISTIDKELFNNFNNLESIDLSNNKITDIDENSFINCEKLFSVTLNSNQIKTVSANAFQKCPNLNIVDLSQNPIDSDQKKRLTQNSSPYFEFNKTPLKNDFNVYDYINKYGCYNVNHYIQYDAFDGTASLLLSNSSLTSIKGLEYFFKRIKKNCTKIIINLSENEIDSLDPETLEFLNQYNLNIRIDLDSNKISTIDRDALKQFNNLTSIRLSNNPIADTIFKDFNANTQKSLFFYFNNVLLTNLKDLAYCFKNYLGFEATIIINLSDNKTESLQPETIDLLQEDGINVNLIWSGNKINLLDKEIVKNFSNPALIHLSSEEHSLERIGSKTILNTVIKENKNEIADTLKKEVKEIEQTIKELEKLKEKFNHTSEQFNNGSINQIKSVVMQLTEEDFKLQKKSEL